MEERRIRIGRIDYTNVWPLFHYFPESEFRGEVEFIKQVPAGLNRAMASGEIDMGPISSFAYGEQFDDYLLYPDLSVSALGAVNSILLFHRKPLEEIVNGTFALTNTSASSVNLLKIMLQKFYGGQPAYHMTEPNLHDMMENADGALLIGDDAIRASWHNREYRVTDLGEEWFRHTGMWMSFAVWALRKETAERLPKLTERLYRAFMESKRKGISDTQPIIEAAAAKIGGEVSYWRRYFAALSHDFGNAQWNGLALYYRYAWELGFLPRQVPLQIWNDNTLVR